MLLMEYIGKMFWAEFFIESAFMEMIYKEYFSWNFSDGIPSIEYFKCYLLRLSALHDPLCYNVFMVNVPYS